MTWLKSHLSGASAAAAPSPATDISVVAASVQNHQKHLYASISSFQHHQPQHHQPQHHQLQTSVFTAASFRISHYHQHHLPQFLLALITNISSQPGAGELGSSQPEKGTATLDFGFWSFGFRILENGVWILGIGKTAEECADFLCRAFHVMDSEPARSLHRASCTVWFWLL